MSEDKREAIIARLMDVAKTVFAADNVHRNTTQFPEKARPACIILDGDEESDNESVARGGPPNSAAIMVMTPEIHVAVSDDGDDVGTTLNTWRGKIIKAIVTDTALVALTLGARSIRVEGFASGFSAGRNMEAQGVLQISFRYVLRPDKF